LIKAVEIDEIKPCYIICKFSDSSKRKLYIAPVFAENPRSYSAQKVLNQQNFKDDQIGTIWSIILEQCCKTNGLQW